MVIVPAKRQVEAAFVRRTIVVVVPVKRQVEAAFVRRTIVLVVRFYKHQGRVVHTKNKYFTFHTDYSKLHVHYRHQTNRK